MVPKKRFTKSIVISLIWLISGDNLSKLELRVRTETVTILIQYQQATNPSQNATYMIIGK